VKEKLCKTAIYMKIVMYVNNLIGFGIMRKTGFNNAEERFPSEAVSSFPEMPEGVSQNRT